MKRAGGILADIHAHACCPPGPGYRGALLLHILKVAKARGYTRLSLETGTVDAFHPAQKLYTSMGFVTCGPFASYQEDPHSLFMVLDL